MVDFEFREHPANWVGFKFTDEDGVNWVVITSGSRGQTMFDMNPTNGYFAVPSALPDLPKFRHFFPTELVQQYYIKQLEEELCHLRLPSKPITEASG